MTDLLTQSLNINRVQNKLYKFNCVGLMPGTKHNIFIDNVNYGFATRQFGKDFGDDLITDNNGSILLAILYEIPYGRTQNFELPETQSLSYQTNIFNQQNRSTNVVKNYKIIELKTPDEASIAQFILNLNMLLTAGPVNTLYPIE